MINGAGNVAFFFPLTLPLPLLLSFIFFLSKCSWAEVAFYPGRREGKR